MAGIPDRLMSADEFYECANAPERDDCLHELHFGRVAEFPVHGVRHGCVCGSLCHVLGTWAQRGGGFAPAVGAGVLTSRNPDSILAPDMLIWDGVTSFADLSDTYSDKVPVFVAEVAEAEESLDDLRWRIEQYIRIGVPLTWVIDPGTRDVIDRKHGGPEAVLRGEDELTGGDVLPGFRCNVSDLFKMPGE